MPRGRRVAALLCVVTAACTDPRPKDSGPVDDTDSGQDSASSGWAYAAAGWFLSCGIHLDGRAECWGLEGLTMLEDTGCCGYFDSGVNVPPSDPLSSLALVLGLTAAGAHACGLGTDGNAICWGRNDYGQADAPEGQFVSVDVFQTGSCGLRKSGEVVCWGGYYEGTPGVYRELSTGVSAAVALDAEGSAHSWWTAYVTGGKMPETRTGPFTTVSVGAYACALRPDGTLFCWDPGFPESDESLARVTPAGSYTAVSAGRGAICALQPDGHPVCFGKNPDQAVYDVPDVSLIQISTGTTNACGVTADHAMVCWGDNEYGQSSPPT